MTQNQHFWLSWLELQYHHFICKAHLQLQLFMPEVLLMHPEYNVFSGDTLIIKYSENYTVTSQKVFHGYCIKIEIIYAFFCQWGWLYLFAVSHIVIHVFYLNLFYSIWIWKKGDLVGIGVSHVKHKINEIWNLAEPNNDMLVNSICTVVARVDSKLCFIRRGICVSNTNTIHISLDFLVS